MPQLDAKDELDPKEVTEEQLTDQKEIGSR